MRRVLCSTGALVGRPNGRDFRLLTGLADRLQCDGFFGFVNSTGYKGDFTVESTSFDNKGVINIEKINRSLLAVRELIGGQPSRAEIY